MTSLPSIPTCSICWVLIITICGAIADTGGSSNTFASQFPNQSGSYKGGSSGSPGAMDTTETPDPTFLVTTPVSNATSGSNSPNKGLIVGSHPPQPDSQGDCVQLLNFKSQIFNWDDFSAGNNVSGWSQGSRNNPLDCCSWDFVSCSNGRVVSLIMDGYQMDPKPEGKLSPALAALEQLCNLTIKNTNISGQLPWKKHGGFTRVVEFVLANNVLTGSLPAGYGDSSYFSNLQLLDVSYNLLTGSLPGSWGSQGSFPSLMAMSLANNEFEGKLPLMWGTGYSFKNLKILKLQNNMLSGVLPNAWSAGWQSLIQLNISNNALSGALPLYWANQTGFKRLETLGLRGNSLSGRLPDQEWLPGPNQPPWSLRQLDLADNLLTGNLPSSWTNSWGAQLTYLNVSNNSLSGNFPTSWTKDAWGNLLALDLSQNRLSGSLPAAWGANGVFQVLQLLDLSSNHLQGTLPDAWRLTPGAWPKLADLNLASNWFTGQLPEAWSQNAGLKTLSSLDLSGNSFSNASLPDSWALRSFDYLRRLSLASNDMIGTLPPSWGKRGAFPLLTTLQLSDNNFEGPVPPTWTGVLASVWLKPGNEDLCGPIPPQMSACEVTDMCPSSLSTCSCKGLQQAGPPCSGNIPGQSPGSGPGANPFPPNLTVTLRLTPMRSNNFSQQLQQQLVEALQAILPPRTTVFIVSIEDLVISGGDSRRRLLATTRELLQAPSPSAQVPSPASGPAQSPAISDAVTAGQVAFQNQPHDSVNITIFLATESPDAAVQATKILLNVTASNQLLTDLHNRGLGNLSSLRMLTTPQDAPPPLSYFRKPKGPAPSTPLNIKTNSNKLSPGTIAAIVLGPMVGAICFTALACLLWHRRKKRIRSKEKPAEVQGSKEVEDGLFAGLGNPLKEMPSWETLGADNQLATFIGSGATTGSNRGELELPFSDWEARPEEYEIVKRSNGEPWELGRGNFGVVFKALRNGVCPVAIKFMNNGPMNALSSLSNEKKSRYLEEFKREILILKACRDKNIVLFLGASLAEGRAMLVTEYMEQGDLFRAIQADDNPSQRRFSWYGLRANSDGRRSVNGLSKRVALDVARGLSFLHSRNVVHFDLKSANILLARDYTAKLTDVGLAKILSKEYITTLSGSVGTFAWAAPEILLGRDHISEKVDIYSMGVVLWELSTIEAPEGRKLRKVLIPSEAPQEIVNLIYRCLSEHPEERPSAVELVQLIEAIK